MIFLIRVGLLGCGVVGSGVAEILLEKSAQISESAGEEVALVRILDRLDFPGKSWERFVTRNPREIVAAPDIDIVVECMGGVEPAGSWLMEALEAGQSAVTSNKEMVVARGELLEEAARISCAGFYAEASVAGGIPVLRPLKMCLAANAILRIGGILNGTTNYILTRMQGGAAPFEAALAEAQKLGYAESDPSADVLGHDARRKLAILSHIALGARLADDALIPCRGIETLAREDMMFAQAMNRTIRLIAMGEACGASWSGWVAPVLLPAGHPLAGVSDAFNAVTLKGDSLGDAMFYGRGAGREPTASAVVADIIEAARLRKSPWHWRALPPRAFSAEARPVRWFFRLTDCDAARSEIFASMPDARLLSDVVPAQLGVITREAAPAWIEERMDALAKKGLAPSMPIRYDNP